jgi:hypothetical protein
MASALGLDCAAWVAAMAAFMASWSKKAISLTIQPSTLPALTLQYDLPSRGMVSSKITASVLLGTFPTLATSSHSFQPIENTD